ncbi:MAG: DUF5666 domain-containing protein [Candidatus Berkelbacteria bacterium]|nr:DUF5666 domain-containing protein [Candidatus Berkelbacteria bacterium]
MNEEKEEITKEKVSEKCCGNLEAHNHWQRHRPFVMIMCGFVFLFILFAVFCAGRVSQRRVATRNAVVEQTVAPGGMRGGFGGGKTMGGRGQNFNEAKSVILGQITNIDGSKLTVKTNDQEYTVNIADATSISQKGEIKKLSDLKTSEIISASGTAGSNGEITATRIVIE